VWLVLGARNEQTPYFAQNNLSKIDKSCVAFRLEGDYSKQVALFQLFLAQNQGQSVFRENNIRELLATGYWLNAIPRHIEKLIGPASLPRPPREPILELTASRQLG
jgi:hypothetical protein